MKDKKDKLDVIINRRQFLSLFAGLTAAAACPVFFSRCDNPDPVPGISTGVSSAWVGAGNLQNSYNLFKQTMESATDFSWLSSGDSVFIKLAIDSFYPFPATTDPVALDFMIKLLKEKGAGNIYAGDQAGVEHVFHLSSDSLDSLPTDVKLFFQMIFNIMGTTEIKSGSTRECCQRAGLLNVILSNGATPVFFEEAGFDAYNSLKLSDTNSWDTAINITNAIDNVDHIINLPRVASHFLAGTTLGLMLAAGYMRTDSRIIMYSDKTGFHEKYVDVNFLPGIESKVRLTASSGMKIMTSDGPDTGTIGEPATGLVFASENILAHDLLATAWLEANRPQVSENIDIYNYPSIKYYISKKGSIDSIAWDQLNQNPDTATVDFMKVLMKI